MKVQCAPHYRGQIVNLNVRRAGASEDVNVAVEFDKDGFATFLEADEEVGRAVVALGPAFREVPEEKKDPLAKKEPPAESSKKSEDPPKKSK